MEELDAPSLENYTPWTIDNAPICFKAQYKEKLVVAFLKCHAFYGWVYELHDKSDFKPFVTFEEIFKDARQFPGMIPCGAWKGSE